MTKALFNRISIVGVGLLGGSLGMAALGRGLATEVIGVGRTATSLQEAERLGAVTGFTTDIAQGVSQADLVVLCTPVRHIADILPSIVQAAPQGAIITDVGSTKVSITESGDKAVAGTGRFFVGSHPMAGSEKSGVRFGREDLFEESTCFVTRTAQTDNDAFGRVTEFWRALGCRIVVSRPERHDRLTAMVSHLPHMVAVALVQAVDQFNEDRNLIKGIVGNGFRDTTRIAAGNSDMWENICLDNREEIGVTHAALVKAFDKLLGACDADSAGAESLREIFDNAREFREFLETRKDAN